MIDLPPEDCQRILQQGRVAHIANVSGGEPYVTPMSYAMVDGDFCFRTGPGRRVDSLEVDPSVCVDVTILREGDAWESVIFWGTANFVESVQERSKVVQALLDKYHEEPPTAISTPSPVPEKLPIVRITPERITGRSSGGGFGTKTRPGRL